MNETTDTRSRTSVVEVDAREYAPDTQTTPAQARRFAEDLNPSGEAQETYRLSVAAGQPVTGSQLAKMYGRSARWGQLQIKAVKNDADISPAEPEQARCVAGVPQWVMRVAVVAVAAVAVVAALVSYAHMWLLARHVGEEWRAWLFPVSVDGLITAASLVIYVARAGHRGRKLAYFSLALGIAVSIAANLLSAIVSLPMWVGWSVTAWPPIALFLAYELMMKLVNTKEVSA